MHQKAGHFKAECWAKGGSKEGQNPRKNLSNRGNGTCSNRAEQAVGAPTNHTYAIQKSAQITGTKSTDQLKWYTDTTATSHFATKRSMFKTYEPLKNKTVARHGIVKLECKVRNRVFHRTLKNVMHIPAAPNCLISISQMDDIRGGVMFSKGKCELRDKGISLEAY